MNSAQLSTGLSRVTGSLEALERAWGDARQHWDDATGARFEEQYIKPILRQLNGIREVTVPMSECLAQARRECEA